MRPIATFAARTNDPNLLRLSSSGGVFTELSRVVLADGGVVFGAAWAQEPLRVAHRWVDCETDLAALRGSKYVPSDMTGVYPSIRDFLGQRRKVLFTGTPCQVAAVRRTFGDDPNLVLCAVLCFCVADIKYWNKYRGELEKRAACRLQSVEFKSKSTGWRNCSMRLCFEDDSKSYSEPLYGNDYAHSFFAGYSTRESCLGCRFRDGKCGADIIMGDLWSADTAAPEWDDDLGASCVLVFTKKGEQTLRKSSLALRCVGLEDLVKKNSYHAIRVCYDRKKRGRFISAIDSYDFHGAVRYADDGARSVRLALYPYRLLRRLLAAIVRRIWR